ncbi:hypothetical protein ACFSTI_01875 [Rhizorhabdus histidinilytica]
MATKADVANIRPQSIGTSIPRREDPGLLTGRTPISPTSPCPACCTSRSCAARWRMAASSGWTCRPPARCRGRAGVERG